MHVSVFAIVRALAAGPSATSVGSLDDDTPRGQVARPILRAAFAFLAAFTHRNPENQGLVWRGASDVLEASVGLGLNAEAALAEVRMGPWVVLRFR